MRVGYIMDLDLLIPLRMGTRVWGMGLLLRGVCRVRLMGSRRVLWLVGEEVILRRLRIWRRGGRKLSELESTVCTGYLIL
jgi:hypothetical protein